MTTMMDRDLSLSQKPCHDDSLQQSSTGPNGDEGIHIGMAAQEIFESPDVETTA